jgi:SAM-dependent methyltransferase
VTDAPKIDPSNADQDDYWNSDDSQHWVDAQDKYDAMLAPYVDRILGAAALTSADRVLDIGCGCGATTLAAAGAVSTGEAVGIDLSKAMIERARQRAIDAGVGNVRFEVADAQTFKLAVPFNAAMSRFGVMFFTDPVAAFRNVHNVLWPGGRLAFVCWQDIAHSEWARVPMATILEHMPQSDGASGPPSPGEPGPFAFADPDHVRSVLTDAGFTDIALDGVDDQLVIGGGGGIDEAVDFISHSGIARRTFGDASPEARTAALAAMREALAPYATADGVRLGAGAWLVTARRD